MINKKVYQIEASGLGPFKYEAEGLPPECFCNRGNGQILCNEDIGEGVYLFKTRVIDEAGRTSTG